MTFGAPPSDVLVIGGGLAATALVAALRGRGYEGQIIVASEEDRLPYDRPPLSKHLFDRTEPASLLDEFGLTEDSATWLLGARAVAIAPHGDGGAEVQLEIAEDDPSHRERVSIISPAVVLATGCAPAVPAPLAGALTLATWDDAQVLRRALTPGTRLAIVGGGWIGMELASVATEAGLDVDVIDQTDAPLGRVLPRAVGERIAAGSRAGVAPRSHTAGASPDDPSRSSVGTPDSAAAANPAGYRGTLTFHGGSVATGVSARDVTLASGAKIPADVVVAAVGVTPRTDWMPPAWLDRARRVVVGASGEVAGVPGVWAIGDIASSHQHWNSAVESAERAADAILSRETGPAPAPHVFSTMFGHDVDVIGWPTASADVTWREDGETAGVVAASAGAETPSARAGRHAEVWTALLSVGGRLTAGVVVGRPRDAAGLKRLLAGGPAACDVAALADPTARLPRH